MNNPIILVDIMSLVLSVSILVITIILTIRTEKELDISSKLFLSAALVWIVAVISSLDAHLGIISLPQGATIFHYSRAIVLSLVFLGLYHLLRAISKKSE